MEPSASLFHFEWWVDQRGYELVYKKAESRGSVRTFEGWHVQRKGGPVRAYRPLEDHRGLFRRFAHLTPEKESILEFITEFGFLFPHNQESELVNDWLARARGMAEIVQSIDEGRTDEVMRLFNDEISAAGTSRGLEPIIPVFVLRRYLPHFSIRIGKNDRARTTLQVVPQSLIGAMWFQVAEQITDETDFRKCGHCPTWFPVGRGTGHKRTRIFCSTRCRVAWNRRKGKETSK